MTPRNPDARAAEAAQMADAYSVVPFSRDAQRAEERMRLIDAAAQGYEYGDPVGHMLHAIKSILRDRFLAARDRDRSAVQP